jgi:hypothetical protein
MNQPSTSLQRGHRSAARRRLLVLAGILVVSTALSLYVAIANAAVLSPLNWAVVGLTALAATAMGLLARTGPIDRRLAAAAVVIMAVRALVTIALYLSAGSLTSVTFVFGIALPIFFLWYMISAIREIRREPAAA